MEEQRKTSSSMLSSIAPTGKAAEETLHAIVLGEADAIVVETKDGPQVYTLRDASEPYRQLVERMTDAAVVVDSDSTILYSNGRLGPMLGLDNLSGRNFIDLVAPDERSLAVELLSAGAKVRTVAEIVCGAAHGKTVAIRASAAPISFDNLPCVALVIGKLDEIAALRESEESLRELGDSLPDSLVYRYTRTAAGEPRFLYISAGIEKLNGLSVDDVLCDARTLLDQIPLEYRQTLAETERRSASDMSDFHIELPMRRADGELRWMRLQSRPRCTPGGNVIWLGVQTDITEGRRAQEALRQSQKLMAYAADAARLTYAEFDLSNGRLHIARNYADVMGYAPESPSEGVDPSRTISYLLNHVVPDDRPCIQIALQQFLSGRLSGNLQYRVLGDDGAERWIDGTWSAETDSNGRTRVIATGLDISALVRGKDALQAAKDKSDEILSSIADGFYALDQDWRFVFFNLRAEELLGKKGSEVLGRPFFEVFPQVKHSQVFAKYAWVMAEKLPLEFESISPILERSTSFSVYPTREGGISVCFRNISQQKAIERQLMEAKAEAERANLAKSKFLAAASHDLRQPVQSLTLLMNVIKQRVADKPKVAEAVEMAQGSVSSLNGMLAGILDISRLDAGVVAPELASVNLGEVIERLVREYQPRAAASNLELRVAPRFLTARTDAALLERIIRNLIENALRYTERGGVLVGLRQRGDRVRLDVIDTGMGIPADKQTEIFEEFRQINNPARDSSRGLGLGLAIVSRLAQLLGVEVQVFSELNRGTRFSLVLPRDQGAPAVDAPAPQIEDPGGRILVVEDNTAVRRAYELMLTDWGYEVLVAANGEEALACAERENWRFDAILADHRLGAGLTGTATATETARRAGRSIPTIVVTGDTARNRLAEVFAGGFAMLHKPVEADDLRRTLASLLRKSDLKPARPWQRR